MDNPINILLKNIIDYFTEPANEDQLENYHKLSTLVRIHGENLLQHGDVSFPGKPSIWINYFLRTNRHLIKPAFEMLSDNPDLASAEKSKFLDAAKQWKFAVKNVVLRPERIHLHLNRSAIIDELIKEVLKNDKFGYLKQIPDKNVYLLPLALNDSNDMCLYRSKLVYKVLQQLLKYSRWRQVDKAEGNFDSSLLSLQVQTVAFKYDDTSSSVIIKCGLVTDSLNKGKRCQIRANEYLRIRSNDMTLLALHKYGIRVKHDARFSDLMDRLGCAAATVDLLEVKHTSPVQIIRNGQGSTKGASFILYNSARLETILRTFQERINEGVYNPLPAIDTIQFTLLDEEEEWQLVYVYLGGFPNLIERCMNQLDNGLCSIHLIIHFLHGLVSTFSVYYRRIRILTENRDHLMPHVNARIYLIKAVREVLNKTLALLDIAPVEFM